MESCPSRVCLIVPPSIFLLDERVFVNLGILKVAASLEEAGVPLDMVDLSGINNGERALADYLDHTDTQIFGITATTPQMPQAFRLASFLRERRSGARIILGGPHVTLVHTAYKKEQSQSRFGRACRAMADLEALFDVLVSGDGEDAVLRALEPMPPKVIDANDRRSPLFMSKARYNASPYPARHLIDLDSYHYQIEGRRATSLIAQLGCPFACGFCGGREAPFLRTVRTRSIDNIIAEIEMLHRDYGYTGFMFYDDELNVNPKMNEVMEALIRLQEKLGADFRLRGFVKAELFNERQARLMVRAGFRWLLSGFESGAPRILDNMNKKATREDNSRCIAYARAAGLKVKALMSLGHPGESAETVAQSKAWLLEARPDDFDVTIITTYPGSPYYDHALAHETRDGVWVYTTPKTDDRLYSYEVDYNEVADYYKGDPDGGYRAYVYTDYLTSKELVACREGLERGVRAALDIPFNPSRAAVHYEHSMGQMGLPGHILRSSQVKAPVNQSAV